MLKNGKNNKKSTKRLIYQGFENKLKAKITNSNFYRGVRPSPKFRPTFTPSLYKFSRAEIVQNYKKKQYSFLKIKEEVITWI